MLHVLNCYSLSIQRLRSIYNLWPSEMLMSLKVIPTYHLLLCLPMIGNEYDEHNTNNAHSTLYLHSCIHVSSIHLL